MATELLRALRLVARVDSDPKQLELYQDIKSRSLLLRFVDFVYNSRSSPFLKKLLCGCYFIVAYLKLSGCRSGEFQVLSVSCYPNEQRAISRLDGLLPDLAFNNFSRRLSLGSAAVSIIFLLKQGRLAEGLRIWKLLDRISRRHSFLLAFRLSDTIACYARFKQELVARPFRFVAVASHYSPDGAALLLASRSLRIPSVYAPDEINFGICRSLFWGMSCQRHDQKIYTERRGVGLEANI